MSLFFTGSHTMIMNKPVLRWSTLFLGAISPLFVAGYLHHQRNNFSCETHVTIVEQRAVIDLIMNFSFANGAGTYEGSGDYLEENKPPVAISNKVGFTYWREEGEMILVSNETNILPKKHLNYLAYVPDFFQHRERGIRLNIRPANADSYYFSYSDSPVMYCTKG